MNAGVRRHIVEIQASTSVVNSDGGLTMTWSTVTNGRRWARVVPISGNESFISAHLQGAVSHRIEMDWLAGVTNKHRVLLDSTRKLDILDIVNIEERNVTAVLHCAERFTE